jgi:hypothetical protein
MTRIPPILKRPLPVVGKLARDNNGATAIMLAVALSGIVGFAGLGSEVAGWYYTTRSMQGAASSAAASAAAELAAATVGGSSISNDQLTHTGRAVSATFSFSNGVSSTTVTVNHPPATTTGLDSSKCDPRLTGASAYGCYVEVLINQPQPALLSSLFMSSGPTIAARAVALANTTASDTGCVVALDRHASRAMNAGGSGTLTFNNCSLYSNSDASDGIYVGGSGTVNALSAYVVGNVNGTVNTTNGTYTGRNPTVDPYGTVAVPSSSTTCGGWTPNGNSSLHLSSSNSATLYPSSAGGTCAIPQNIQVDGSGTLNFCPGVYVFNGGASLTLNASAIMNAPPQNGPTPPATTPTMTNSSCPSTDRTGGVTLVFVNSSGNPGAPSVNGSAVVNMVAPTSGATSGLAMFQRRTTCTGNGSNSCNAQLAGGGTQNINGALYFPNNAISYSGGSSTSGYQCTQLIADTISYTGGSTFNSQCSSSGTQTINATNGTLVM